MFVGLFLLWLNLIAAILLLGIIGYGKMAEREEQLLVKRFGDDYLEYKRKSGRFDPKMIQR